MPADPRLALYKRLLLAWNEKVNLVGPEAAGNIDEHIDEALAAADLLKPVGEVLDFGSGGGLPAIPMAIVSARARFHLVEADQRKWAFLKHVVRECALNAVVYGDRLQRVLPSLPRNLNLVTSRAVGHPEDWLPPLASHMADGGRVALFQGSENPPIVPPFTAGDVYRLPRGESNFLVALTFHVEQR
jgi:16S rRNA (guanine527-N7)-methyltransferase